MSGSDMASREQFTVGMHKPQQPQLHQNMRLDYAAEGTAVFAAPTININGGDSSPSPAVLPPGLGLAHAQVQAQAQTMGSNSSEQLKRKRGRPRKYGPDGGMALTLTPAPPSGGGALPVGQSGGAFPPAPLSDSASAGTVKRRGRPRGSVNKNKKSLKYYGPGASFTPHVITVKAGEDLSARIMAISQSSSRNICILTANGAISNVTLRQPASSGGTVTYEGRFEILSLGGSLFLAETGGQQPERAGGLNVSLSGPDGRVLGGGVAGLLIAASPVQIVLASFVSDVRKQLKFAKRMENASAPPKVSTAGQSSSPSRGTLSESSGGVGSGSPLNQSTGACNNTINNNTPAQGFSGMPWK